MSSPRLSRPRKKIPLPFDLGEADVRAHARSKNSPSRRPRETCATHFFGTCAKAHRCRRIFLAHHADDQIETCLFNFLRGTGAAGLAGMSRWRIRTVSKSLRPMLGSPGRDHTRLSHRAKRPISRGCNQCKHCAHAQPAPRPSDSRNRTRFRPSFRRQFSAPRKSFAKRNPGWRRLGSRSRGNA